MPADAPTAEAPAASPLPPPVTAPKEGAPPDFDSLFAGLDGINTRLTGRQQKAFAALDASSDNPTESKARAINQAFVGTKLAGKLPAASISANWDAVKGQYAKQVLGVDKPDISDTDFYGKVGERLQADREARTGTIAPWTFQRALGGEAYEVAQSAKDFWQSINKPFGELAKNLPEHLDDVPGLGWMNPAVAHGTFAEVSRAVFEAERAVLNPIYRGATKPVAESIESPAGVAMLGTGAAAKAGLPAAKEALMGMEGLFTGAMAVGAAKQAPAWARMMQDPTKPLADKIESTASMTTNTLFAVAGAVGLAMDLVPEAQKAVQAKTPGDAAANLREEAKTVQTPTERAALTDAASKLQEIADTAVGHTEIRTAAIRTEDGSIYTGAHHEDARAAREADGNASPEVEAGFLTQEGGFVDREKAMGIAREAAQVREGVTRDALHSEDLIGNEKEGSASPAPQQAAAPAELPAGASPVSIKNAWVDEELERMGEEPATHDQKLTFKGVVEDTAKVVAKDPGAAARLLDDLEKSPRAPTVFEDVLATFELKRLRDERLAADQALSEAKAKRDPDVISAARARVVRSQDAFMRGADIVTKAGTRSAQALAFRRVALREDYSLAAVEKRVRDAQGGKPLTADQSAQVADLTRQLEEANRKLAEHAKARKSAPARARPTEGAPSTRKGVRDYLSARAVEARARIRQRLTEGRVSAGLDPQELIDHAIVGADLLAKGVTKFGAWSARMIGEFGERIRPHLDELFKASKAQAQDAAKAVEERRLQAFKTRKQKTIETRQDELAGQPPPPKPEPIKLDAEGVRLQASAERLKQKIDLMHEKARLQERTILERARDYAISLRRAFALSFPTVIAKLTGAAAIRMISTPLEQAAGYGISKALPRLAEMAPREGVPEFRGALEAEAKAIRYTFVEGLKGAAQLLKGGQTDISLAFGKERLPPELIEYLGNLHSALKEPAKMNEFGRSLEMRAKQAIREGIDVDNPIVQMRLGQEAYQDANRAVFLNDNRFVGDYNRLLSNWESRGGAWKVAATAARLEAPIVKVPTNIIAEASTYIGGSLTGPAKAIWAYAHGLEGLKPVEADAIMRHLKKGSIGLAIMALGYFKWQQAGGLYTPGQKEDQTGLKPGEVKVGDTTIPAGLMHAPIADAFNVGATIGRLVNQHNHRKDPEGYGSAFTAALLGLAEGVPFVRESFDLAKLRENPDIATFAGEQAKSLLVPGVVQYLAQKQDAGKQRVEKGAIDPLKAGIPYLRETLPERKPGRSLRK